MKNYYVLFTIFFLWSTSSLVVVNFKNILPPFQSASLVALISTVFVTAGFFLFRKSKLKALLKCNMKSWAKIFVLSFFGFFLYPICYFHGLHSGQPVEANIINYFWPLATVVFGFFLNVDKFSIKKLFSVMFGFFGVIIAASTIPILHGSQQVLTWNPQYVPAYLFAGLGALSFGLYSALRKKFLEQGGEYANLDIQSRFLGYLWVSLSLHLVINLINLGSQNSLIISQITLKPLIFIFIYSLLNFSLAYYLWAYTEKLPSFYTSMMAFLIPPISAIALSLFSGIPLNSNSIFGLLLIVIGLSIYQDYQNYINPLTGFLVTFDLFGLLRVAFPGKLELVELEITIGIGLVQIVVAIFSILASFILARAVHLYREERDLFLKIEDRLVRIAHLGDLEPGLMITVDTYMNYMIDNEARFEQFDLASLIGFEKQSKKYISEMYNAFKIKKTSPGEIAQFKVEIDDLQEKISQWKFLKSEALSSFEWLILAVLIVATVSLVFVSRGNNRWHDFSTVALSSCLALFMFAIRDYDLRCPTNKPSFILMTQRISELAQVPPYMPYALIEHSRITKSLELTVKQKIGKFVRTKQGNTIVEVDFKATNDFYYITSYALGMIVFILICYVILK
jgi:drug/metabolite transporter (DMT)-like permease